MDNYRDMWLLTISVAVAMLAIITYTTARNAESVAERTAGQIQAQTIQRELICSETNQGACQALSERLFSNLSASQRRRWACDLLAYLAGPNVERVRRVSRCPRPLRPPPSTLVP